MREKRRDSQDKSFGAVVFRTISGEKEFLLVKHRNGGHWDHPKGHSEQGESLEETVCREVREEAHLTIELIDGFRAETGWILPDGRYKKVTYLLARENGSCPPEGPEDEILERSWLAYEQALERTTYDSGKRVLKEAADFLLQT